jgi:hypothetical protein
MNHNDFAHVARCAIARGALHKRHSPEWEREQFTIGQLIDKALSLVDAATAAR